MVNTDLMGTRMRLTFLGVIFTSLIAALVLRLYFLQILSHSTYREAAQTNQVRLIPSEPARGRILDRNGEVLVDNRVSLVVSVREDQVKDRDRTLNHLSQVLRISRQELDKRLQDRTLLPYAPIPVAEDVPEETMVYIREHQEEFPGVMTETRPVRRYPNGKLAAHVLGYLGEINREQLETKRYRNFRPGSIIGRSGIEYAYEHELHGTEGLLKLEVDARNKVRRVLGRRDPIPGQDLVSTIDAKIQKITEESLAQGIEKARTIFDRESGKRYVAPAGGAVVMDPNNGEIIAMASFPDYDPAAFIGGISRSEFEALSGDVANPLLNRVIQAAFPPGSTFKTVTAAAALEEGIASPTGRYDCPRQYRYANQTWRNWKPTDSGILTVPQAMADSCDTVFYPWGAEFYRRFRGRQGELLQRYAREYGFGSRTGIEIPFEKAGRVPDEGWLQEMHRKYAQAFPYNIWLPGYTVNMSIGQGDVLATPLQLASHYAALANGGTFYRPHLGLRLKDGDRVTKTFTPERKANIDISPANLAAIRAGLEAVTTVGTASSAFAGFPLEAISVGAKTGTAEIRGKQPYAWFAAYAPANDPKYVVVVMLEEGGHGGETAAPIARRILEGIFELSLSEVSPSVRTD
ncbi:MAG: penicillin-binding protein 2 [Actinomycetota bacterium]|nr:penicillin-binding protein 2 [Actinomycetota bacterium]